MKTNYQLIVIGGGPAGLAAALSAREQGLNEILIVERDAELGGILNQCIHNGFGLHVFKEELTGPEYAGRFIEKLKGTGIELLLDSMVLDLVSDGDEKILHVMSSQAGYLELRAAAVILAMGCRERTRGAIQIPGSRPAGVFTAGTAQRYVNIEGYEVGRRVLILGSGDIGLIMARRLTLEGAKVLACVELMPFSGGLNRNIVQCLQDFDIPLYLSHTITKIEGKKRVKRVTVQRVDENMKAIPGTEIVYEVDTVLLSVGLIPENELSRSAGIALDPRTQGPLVDQTLETNLKGVYAAGNVLHVHDLVDFVSEESERAGAAAAQAVLGLRASKSGDWAELQTDANIAYTVPQKISLPATEVPLRLFFRVRKIYTQPTCLVLSQGGRELARFRKPHMAPGEMQNINLNAAICEKLSAEPLQLTLEEV